MDQVGLMATGWIKEQKLVGNEKQIKKQQQKKTRNKHTHTHRQKKKQNVLPER